MEIIGGIFGVIIVLWLLASDGLFDDIRAVHYNKSLNKHIPLPAGAKFKYTKWDNKVHLIVDVNHGTGKPKDWRSTLRYSMNSVRIDNDGEFTSELKALTHVAKWMREQYINTDEFTSITNFPLEEGDWELGYVPTEDEVLVNGITVVRAEFNDYRDAVVAMIQASPQIKMRHREALDAARQQRSVERVMSKVNPITTR